MNTTSTEAKMIRETYKGRKLVVKPVRKEQTTKLFVNGQAFATVYGCTAAIMAREIKSLRGWVDAADERRIEDPNAYPAYWYEGAEHAA